MVGGEDERPLLRDVLKPDRPHPGGWARCLPSENRAKGAGEWNHYRVTANNGVIKLAVNGQEVSGVSECKPRKGYLALESEGSECRFKNLKIKELPSSNPPPDEVANVAQDFHQLFTGLDLSGWKHTEDQAKHWQPKQWGYLSYDGKATGPIPWFDPRWLKRLSAAETPQGCRGLGRLAFADHVRALSQKIEADLAAQQCALRELHIERAYLASQLVQQRSETLTIFCKAWPVRQGPYFPNAHR